LTGGLIGALWFREPHLYIHPPPSFLYIWHTSSGKVNWKNKMKQTRQVCIREAKKRMRRRKNTLLLVNHLGNLIHFYSPPISPDIITPLLLSFLYMYIYFFFRFCFYTLFVVQGKRSPTL
jgi:hypothetical protein